MDPGDDRRDRTSDLPLRFAAVLAVHLPRTETERTTNTNLLLPESLHSRHVVVPGDYFGHVAEV